MKNLFAVLIIVLLVFGCIVFANAAPFLVCDPADPAEKVDRYLVKLDTGDEIAVPAPLHYDLAGIADGAHVIEVKAANVWGESGPAPFAFEKKLPALPIEPALSTK